MAKFKKGCVDCGKKIGADDLYIPSSDEFVCRKCYMERTEIRKIRRAINKVNKQARIDKIE